MDSQNNFFNENRENQSENKGATTVPPEVLKNNEGERGRFFGLGIASMVLGIVSVLCCCFFGMPILLSVTAIVFASLRMSKKPDGFSIAGLVTGIVGVVFNTLMLIFALSSEGRGVMEDFSNVYGSIQVLTQYLFVW